MLSEEQNTESKLLAQHGASTLRAHSAYTWAGFIVLCFILLRRTLMEVVTVGVVGAGTMGNGIAHVFAKAGYQVMLCDLKPEYLDRAIGFISKNLEREVEKQKITADDRKSALERIRTCTDRTEFKACDFVVEAATERFDVKREIFQDLD